MARPPLDPGTHGNISAKETATGEWLARCRYCDLNGEIIRPSATGPTKAAAIRALQKKLTAMTTAAAKDAEITADDFFKKATDKFVEGLEYKARNGTLSKNSLRTYLSVIDNHVRPRFDKLRIRHAMRPHPCNELVKKVREKHSLATAQTLRTVLGGICGVAVLHDAIDANPVRSIERLEEGTKDRKKIVTMSLEQIRAMWTGLDAFAVTKERDSKGRRTSKRNVVWADLRELSEGMLSTGVRIGELLAVSGDEITRDKDGRVVVAIEWHVVYHKGDGVVRVEGRKGGEPDLSITVPPWAESMWLRRKLAAGHGGPVFTSVTGNWLDPSNTINRLREAMDGSGFGWVTSHVWRHTVAELLDEAGLTLTEIADQLGNTTRVIEKHYRPRRTVNTKGATALEVIKPES